LIVIAVGYGASKSKASGAGGQEGAARRTYIADNTTINTYMGYLAQTAIKAAPCGEGV